MVLRLSVPSPGDFGAAAANIVDSVFRGGLADLRPMPSTVIDEGPQKTLHRYLPVGAAPQPREDALPVLLVPPLAAPARCFDLRRGCSLVEHLLLEGRETYLVDYGPIEFGDRDLGLEHWFQDVIPAAVRRVSQDCAGRPVQLVSWCLGGILTALAVADDPGLPVASITMIASPFDFSKVPLVAPLRPIAAVTGGQIVGVLYRSLGGAPAPLVRAGYQLVGLDKYLMKPLTVATHLHDRELLAQIEAVDAFMDGMHAYPGRTFGQLYHRLFRINDLADGCLGLRDHTVHLDRVRVPALAIAGTGDGIAPVAACHHVSELLGGGAVALRGQSPGCQLATAPGGHLGVLTGRAARTTTWKLLGEFLDECEHGLALRAA